MCAMKMPNEGQIENIKGDTKSKSPDINVTQSKSTTNNKTQMIVRCDNNLADAFKRACGRDGRSQSVILRELVTKFVVEMADKPDPEQVDLNSIMSKYQ